MAHRRPTSAAGRQAGEPCGPRVTASVQAPLPPRRHKKKCNAPKLVPERAEIVQELQVKGPQANRDDQRSSSVRRWSCDTGRLVLPSGCTTAHLEGLKAACGSDQLGVGDSADAEQDEHHEKTAGHRRRERQCCASVPSRLSPANAPYASITMCIVPRLCSKPEGGARLPQWRPCWPELTRCSACACDHTRACPPATQQTSSR